MDAIREARAALKQIRARLEAMEARKKELAMDITRKSFLLEDMRAPDMKDIPPAQRLVVPSDVIDVSDPELTDIEWNGTMGLKITLIAGLDHLKKLERVSFRSGFIRKPSGLSQSAATLECLELYENRLKTLDGVQTLVHLTVLDISYNRLGKLERQYLTPLTNLKRLYIAENKLDEIDSEALLPLVNLEMLDLGGNNLRQIQGLHTLVNLKELWLGKNKITKIDGLDTLRSLKRLSIQSNRLTKIENLSQLVELEELYLSDQGIEKIEGLETLTKLNTLDLTNNKITSLEGLPRLPFLTDLWMAANKIASFDQVTLLVPLIKDKIDTLQLERNPVADLPGYRQKVKQLFPTLTYIDADPC